MTEPTKSATVSSKGTENKPNPPVSVKENPNKPMPHDPAGFISEDLTKRNIEIVKNSLVDPVVLTDKLTSKEADIKYMMTRCGMDSQQANTAYGLLVKLLSE